LRTGARTLGEWRALRETPFLCLAGSGPADVKRPCVYQPRPHQIIVSAFLLKEKKNTPTAPAKPTAARRPYTTCQARTRTAEAGTRTTEARTRIAEASTRIAEAGTAIVHTRALTVGAGTTAAEASTVVVPGPRTRVKGTTVTVMPVVRARGRPFRAA
jgi:hypothetical protein